MPVTIEKVFRFDAGHRCMGFHDKKEATLHGHTWNLRVVIEASHELDPYKTVFDSNMLARIVKPIIEEFDHGFIVWGEDPLYAGLQALCEQGGFADKLIRIDFNPTIEGLAEFFFRTVKSKLELSNAVVRRVDLDASATLRASYSE